MIIERLRTIRPGEVLRYGASGAVVYAIDFLTFAAMVHFAPSHYLIANQLAKLAGAISGFFLHKYFTFANQHHHGMRNQFAMYIATFVFNILSSSALLWLLVEVVGAERYVAKIVADVVVIATTFLVGKFLIYRPAAPLRNGLE